MNEQQWRSLSQYCRNKLSSLFDPALASPSIDKIEMNHKGFYIGIVDQADEELVREGFLREGLRDVIASADEVLNTLVTNLKNKDITLVKAQGSIFHFTLVTDVIYIPKPLDWDENKDGVFFQWGQNYKSFYLPYQIQRMNIPKIEIMDRLCCHGAGVPSTLWRYPEGLIFKITCRTFKS